MERVILYSFIVFDAMIFMMLLLHFSDDEVDIRSAASIVAAGLLVAIVPAAVLVPILGVAGAILGAVISTVICGVALSAVFGMALKRAMMLSGIFTIIHLVFMASLLYCTTFTSLTLPINGLPAFAGSVVSRIDW